ncbi:hypothetical protein MMC07_003644 [Pseudocyphellaria aurata]|nr:hypothetical protein [Pseudocyphellaria aurata]
MPRPKRNFLVTANETSTPPTSLGNGHEIARVQKAEGKNLYTVQVPDRVEPLLVELPSRFRSQIWIRRGGYVVVDRSVFDHRENKLDGEIVNIVRDEKQWRKQAYWPAEFIAKPTYSDGSEDESTVGKMPPLEDQDSAEESLGS